MALEAGGSNDIANLWPEAAEPRPGFHEKDQVENYLHDQVCAGTMSLLDAQRAIATNWLDVYRQQSQRAVATFAPPLAPAPQPAPASDVQITSVAGSGPGGRATVVAQTPRTDAVRGSAEFAELVKRIWTSIKPDALRASGAGSA